MTTKIITTTDQTVEARVVEMTYDGLYGFYAISDETFDDVGTFLIDKINPDAKWIQFENSPDGGAHFVYGIIEPNDFELKPWDTIKGYKPDIKGFKFKATEVVMRNEMDLDLYSSILIAVNAVLRTDPQYADPKDCVDCCVMASNQLISELKKQGLTGELVGTKEHAWVFINDVNIDLTARQFDKNAACPKIWIAKK